MASARDLRKKIRSISNTSKITRTMEMVATAKSKRAQGRVVAMLPYSGKLFEILRNLRDAGTVEHPLLEDREPVRRTLLLIVTANRGLCGGYNSGLLSLAEKWLDAEAAAGREVDVYVSGRKGIARLRFLKRTSVAQYTHLDDRPTFKETEELASEFLRLFLERKVDRVVVASTRYISTSVQRPEITQVLPIESSADGGGAAARGGDASTARDFIFEPERSVILETLLPLSVKQAVFRLFLEAATSEQLARRLAMKLASDNAEEMIGLYTRKYNRERQAGITQQIMEVVTGAEALE
jgi:F-type H+-transporting ATPase subunit gamma